MKLSQKIAVPFASTLAVGILALTGCSAGSNATSSDSASASSSASAQSTSSASDSAQGLSFESTWVKATNSDMTAAFGTIKNTTDQPIKIVGAKSSVNKTVQLHTTEIDAKTGTSSMKQTDSFTIEPGQSFNLEPGGNHIMFMDLKCALSAGNTVTITLTDSNGKTYDFDAQARDYQGAKEEYAPGKESSPSHTSEGHSMSDMHANHSASPSGSASMDGMDISGDPTEQARETCAQ